LRIAEIEDVLGTLDFTARMEKYAKLQREIADICPIMFIYDYRVVVCRQDYVDITPLEDPSQVSMVQGYNTILRTWKVLPH